VKGGFTVPGTSPVSVVAAGRPQPWVVAVLPVAVCDDADAGHRWEDAILDEDRVGESLDAVIRGVQLNPRRLAA
jgi:hypothetical protein